jgi:type IV pilus assembly protein PilX
MCRPQTDRPSTGAPREILGNQRGFALVLALGMLAILSILGAMVLSTSMTEIGISGNYRTSREAFFAAERAIEYAMGNSEIVKSTASVDLNATDTTNSALNHAVNLTLGSTQLDPSAANQVVNLGAGQLPASIRSAYGDKFGANYYLISVTGARLSGNAVRSTARIEAQRVRLFPLSSEGLTTTEGG